MKKHHIVIIVLSGLFVISSSWAVVVTGLYGQNSRYMEVGKKVMASAKNIDAQLKKCGSADACNSLKVDMGDKVIDSMVKLAKQRDN